MNNYRYCLLLAFSIFLIACGKEDSGEKQLMDDTLYFNSFENSSEISDFGGNATFISDDVPGNAGDSSLLVSGGCIGLHGGLTLGPYDTDKSISISMYAKCQIPSGGVMNIFAKNDRNNIMDITIVDTVWTLYEPEEEFLLTAFDTLKIEIMSGGVAPVETHFDLFTVVGKE